MTSLLHYLWKHCFRLVLLFWCNVTTNRWVLQVNLVEDIFNMFINMQIDFVMFLYKHVIKEKDKMIFFSEHTQKMRPLYHLVIPALAQRKVNHTVRQPNSAWRRFLVSRSMNTWDLHFHTMLGLMDRAIQEPFRMQNLCIFWDPQPPNTALRNLLRITAYSRNF